MTAAIIILVIAAIAVAGFFAFSGMSGGRQKEMKALAAQFGFNFVGDGDGSRMQPFAGLRSFQLGRTPFERNGMTRVSGQTKITIADLAWFTKVQGGRGVGNPDYIETAICFETPEIKLAEFGVTPGGRLTRYGDNAEEMVDGKKTGYFKVDFEPFSDFSRKYVLFAKDKKTVSALFEKSQLGKAIGETEGIYVEGAKNCLMVYQGRRELTPAELPDFFNLAQKILARVKKYEELVRKAGTPPAS